MSTGCGYLLLLCCDCRHEADRHGRVCMKAGRLVLRDLCATIAIVFTAPGAVLQAQPAAEHLRRADEAYMARNSEEAREHALRALAMDPANYEAHWKAARSEIDLAEVAG